MQIDSSRLWEQIGLGEDSGLELKEVHLSGAPDLGTTP